MYEHERCCYDNQLTQTGLCEDYVNEYSALLIAARLGEDIFQKTLMKFGHFQTYQERFPYLNDYSNPRIGVLNEVALRLNELIDNDDLSSEYFISVNECVLDIIRGE